MGKLWRSPEAILEVHDGSVAPIAPGTLLVTFVLFGHWMEMKARRGTTDALRALFDLVPPKATVLRGDQEVEVPSSGIVVGDLVVLKHVLGA